MGGAASVEQTLQNAPDPLSREQCEELAKSHGVQVKETMFRILGSPDGARAGRDSFPSKTCVGAAAATRTIAFMIVEL